MQIRVAAEEFDATHCSDHGSELQAVVSTSPWVIAVDALPVDVNKVEDIIDARPDRALALCYADV